MASTLSQSDTQPLDWQRTVSTIQDANAYLLATSTFSDVAFVVGETEETVLAHKLILMSRSSVFESLFERWEEETKIYIPEVGLSAFNAFLHFLYTNDYSDVSPNAAQVLHLAHAYDVHVLTKICSNLLNETITISNALQTFKLAKGLEQLDLQDKASIFILKHGQEVFQQQDFYTTELELLCSFIQSDELNMAELEVFKAVMRWAKNKCRIRNLEETSENKRSVADSIVHLVRFPLMEPSEFTSEVVYKENGVLTEQEVIQVYIYFNSKPESRARLFPLLFSTTPREYHYKYGHGRQNYSTTTLPATASKLPAFAAPLTTSYKTDDRRQSKKKRRSWRIGGCV